MDQALQFEWRQYRQWAATSRVLKKQITQTSLIALGLTLAGTAIGTLTPVFVPEDGATGANVLGVVAAVLLGAATYLASQLLGDADRQTSVRAQQQQQQQQQPATP